MENNQQSPISKPSTPAALPVKSNMFIVGNMAAVIIFAAGIIDIVLQVIFGNSFFGNIIISIFALYLGTALGVDYVVKRSVIDSLKIKRISISTASVIFIITELFYLFNMWAASQGIMINGAFSITSLVINLVINIAECATIIFLIRYFLKKKAQV
jgi:hypothetical protein